MNSWKETFELFLISFVALFLELAIIRWLSTEIRIFSYFKNLPLMAAFLGFGVGCTYYRYAETFFYTWFPRLFGSLVFLIVLAPLLGITHVVFVDPRQYILLGIGLGDHAAQSALSFFKVFKALFVIVFVFFLVMATFAALCSKLGELLNRLSPLAGYSINVAGSLLGILGFSAVAFLEWPPVVWLVTAYVAVLYFYLTRPSLKIVTVYFIAAVLVYWSPYYKITTAAVGTENLRGFHVSVNYDGFQLIQGFSRGFEGKLSDAEQRNYNRHYDIPFQLSKRKIASVLVLGGGTGNDAAVAVRNGVKHIDVVEIDPVIARLGIELHPDRPYQSPNVHLHIDDARSFLQKTEQTYDLVIFATLDSHTAFSSLSSLRLDNFVFTENSLRQVREKLNHDGGVAVNFFAVNPWLSQRHFNTLKAAMESEPIALGSESSQENLFLAGNLFDANRDPGQTDYVFIRPRFTSAPVESVTDDWPFLFLEKRGIPFHYLLPLFIIFALSLIPFRYARGEAEGIDWHLFFMGAAFLLIETKAVTSLGLVMGSTWLVNAIVIGSILAMILVANAITSYGIRLSFAVLYGALGLTLALNFLFPFDALQRLEWTLRLAIAGFIVAVPLFVAALIFAKSFALVQSPSLALASNLFGSLVGGIIEYADMWTGIRWLNLIALLLYGLSYLMLRGSERPAKLQAAETG